MTDPDVGRVPDGDGDRAEGFGERLLGSLLDRSHTMPPQLIAPLIAQELGKIGAP